jgi:hypothetical protein
VIGAHSLECIIPINISSAGVRVGVCLSVWVDGLVVQEGPGGVGNIGGAYSAGTISLR